MQKKLLAFLILGALGVVSSFTLNASAYEYPLHISEDNSSLRDATNEPFLMIGDAAWSLIVGTNISGADAYLSDRQARGFNTIMINLIEHQYAQKGAPKNMNGDVPFLQAGNFSTPNEAYFQYADAVIKNATDHNFLILLFPAYLGYQGGSEGWYQEIVNQNTNITMYNYGRYLGNRYKQYNNIIWVMGGDYAPNAAIQRIRELVRGLNDGGEKNWSFTVHNGGGQSGITQYSANDQKWIMLSTTYAYCNYHMSNISGDYLRKYPVFFIEGEYEGTQWGCKGIPSIERAQAYWPILFGSLGTIFGNSNLWYFNSTWPNYLNTQGSNDMTRTKNLFLSRDWHTLVPDTRHEVLTSGYGTPNTNTYVTSSMTKNRNTFIAYDYSGIAMTINLSMFNGTQVKAWWYNPATGVATFNGTFPTSGYAIFNTPNSNDWVLVIDNAASNVNSPGNTTPLNNTTCTTHCNSFDVDCNNSIDFSELNAAADSWYNDQISISQLMLTIKLWKAGSC